jgi:hypothetical protein
MPFDDFNRLGAANFPEQLPSLKSYVTDQYSFPILGYPHKVQVNGKNTMATMSIFAHGLILNKKR